MSTKQGKRMARLFPELIREILLCLPAKPLIRFRCVTKSFCGVIDSPDFIKDHLDRSIKTKTHNNAIIRSCPSDVTDIDLAFPTDFYAVVIDDGDGHGEYEAFKLSNPLNSSTKYIEIFGSCNGLLLLLEYDDTLALWNPFTRRYKKLPICPIKYPRGYNPLQDSSFGFGYDAANDDYKVVCSCFNQVWVFSLKNNSWRRNQNFPFKGYFIPFASGKLSNAALYWLCSTGIYLEKIVVFDLATERFHMLPLPDHPIDDNTDTLDILEGRLWTCSTNSTREFQFYISENDRNGLSWSKLCDVVPRKHCLNRCYSLKPLAYSKVGNKILMDMDCGSPYMIWFDLDKKIIEQFRIRGIPSKIDTTVCWESLVSLGVDSVFDGLQFYHN